MKRVDGTVLSPFFGTHIMVSLSYQKKQAGERSRLGMRIMSRESSNMVYHRPKCRYAGRIRKKNRVLMKWEDAEWKGYRPCKCCDGIDFLYKMEKEKIERYAEQFNLDVDFMDRKIYVGRMWDVGKLFTRSGIRDSSCSIGIMHMAGSIWKMLRKHHSTAKGICRKPGVS